MINVFKSEWQRLYSKKTTWFCFISIPILLICAAKFFLGHNLGLDPSSSKFTVCYNFPVLALQDNLALPINSILILLTVLCVTDEFRSGSIRMVLIRPVKKIHIFYAKFLVIISTVFLFLVTFFVIAYIIGFFTFPKVSNITMLYWNNTFGPMEVFIYTIKAYFIAFLTLVALSSIVFFISIISKSVIIALGSNLAIVILSNVVIQILRMIVGKENILLVKLEWLIIPQMQIEAIPNILGEHSNLCLYGFEVMLGYIILFVIINHLIYLKSDNLV
ncbi:ABC transporter permease [Clostridium sp. SHJSY1]|uniref:ABC transporter permease n=1 Tax=Clostridium sp. SHJSY1 TaxID=2942483 RepID=UPI002876A09D|nr:ABC transporter permease [Clostridium sp. SHJSY1]MDS0527449.1 ABC transporter permease [Clostridium sp. SHJSY1]